MVGEIGKIDATVLVAVDKGVAPLPNANIAGDEVDLLAASGLLNRMPNNASVSPQGIRQADCTFLYRWEMCSTRVASLKRLALLTLLLTVFVFVSLMANLLAKVGEAKIVGAGFLAGSIAESLAPFALGILVCAVLYTLRYVLLFRRSTAAPKGIMELFLRKSEKSSSLRMRSEICPLGIL